MKIYRYQKAKNIVKKSGTRVIYNLFDEYEININIVRSNSSQDWHYHKIKEEIILVINGSINIEWKEGDKIISSKLGTGDLVRVEDSFHRFVNPYSRLCKFICFKLVLSGQSKREILAKDKYSL